MKVTELLKNAELKGRIIYWNRQTQGLFACTTTPRTYEQFLNEKIGEFVGFVVDPYLEVIGRELDAKWMKEPSK